MFLERLTPVITADLGHGDELFAVDTGAMGTILSSAFYEESSVLPSDAKLTSLQLTGAGGTLLTPAYQLQNVATTVAGHCVDIESALLLTEKVNSVNEFHGTIGQSLLTLFDSYTFDFRQMQFTVTAATGSGCPYATAAK